MWSEAELDAREGQARVEISLRKTDLIELVTDCEANVLDRSPGQLEIVRGLVSVVKVPDGVENLPRDGPFRRRESAEAKRGEPVLSRWNDDSGMDLEVLVG